jgi:o-succinylbenzoate synthase
MVGKRGTKCIRKSVHLDSIKFKNANFAFSYPFQLNMSLSFCIVPHTRTFRQPAGTSRGTYTVRQAWYVVLSLPALPLRTGIGECAPLPGLSCDALPYDEYKRQLNRFCALIAEMAGDASPENLTDVLSAPEVQQAGRRYPSMLFGMETAIRHLSAGSFALWDTPFSGGRKGIPINGLIWMGTKEVMLEQIVRKMENGFRCIKLKIGAINFDDELELIRHIRSSFSENQIEIRVDANGAFSPLEAPDKLRRLAALHLHSIEQPIRAGQWSEMARLTSDTPLPIALDEELIGICDPAEKQRMLDTVRPQYIILKPSLHGGLSGCTEWIEEAEKRSIGWWVTSALESNIGLNAIAQWCATLHTGMPQGLGTGALFTDNFDLPLSVRADRLYFTRRHASTGFNTERDSQTLCMNGIPYDRHFALALAAAKLAAGNLPEWERDFYAFITDWWNDSPTLTVHTSGSTGTPKTLSVEKSRMIQSAITTCKALNLRPGNKALLCLPVRYIAGKMMIVRALVAGLDLYPVAPDGHPFANLPAGTGFDFAALIPLQVFNALQSAKERVLLSGITNVIVGGAAIDRQLEEAIATLPNNWFSTYGMTETLSHIALRNLNGEKRSKSYFPLNGVSVSLADDDTLMIDAPDICDTKLITNDMASIHPDGSFEISGRKDNVINSGGVKIQAETVEEKLNALFGFPCVITSLPDERLGEKVVVLAQVNELDEQELIAKCRNQLTVYEVPKRIFFVDALPMTPNGKIDRKAAKIKAQTLHIST